MVEKKLHLLEQNLEKKSDLLGKLLELCDKQNAVLDSSSWDAEDFDACMAEQDIFLQELDRLNVEADELYSFLASEDFSSNEKYDEQIGRIKNLISQLENKTILFQEKEQFTKQKLEVYFQNERKTFGSGRRSSKAALDYYRNMNRSNVVPPQFMDQKK